MLKRSLPIGLVAAFLAGCAPSLPTGRIIDQPDLATRMDTAQATPQRQRRALSGTPLATESAIVASPAMQREVDRILLRLLRDPPMSAARAPRILITAEPGYAAEMSRDGEIHINLGVLARAETEDQIAFVIAHEVSHYLLGHGISRDGSLRTGRGTINLARNASVYGIAMGASRASGQLGASGQRNTSAALMATVATGEALMAIASEVMDASYSRTQELEADRLGMDLMVRAGYVPGAVGSVFNMLEAQQAEQARRVVDLRGSVRAGTFSVGTLFITQASGGNALLGQLGIAGAGFLASAAEQGAGALLSNWSATHDSPAARRTDLVAYEAANHANTPDRNATPNPFQRGALNREVTEVMEALRILGEADAAIQRADPAGARAAMARQDRLLDRRTPVQWRFARARIAAMEGNEAERGRLLREATSHPQAYAAIFIEYARFLSEREDYGGALAALDQGERAFGTPEPFIAERVRALRVAKRDAEMTRVLATCRQLNVGPIERACSDQARNPA